MTDRTVKVRLEAIVGPYQQAMAKASEATRTFTGRSEADLKRLGAQMQRTGVVLSASLTAPLVLLGKQAADTAMAAQESTSRMNTVFGRNAAVIREWSEGSARSMGLARHEAESAASTLAVMFEEMELGTSDVLNMSTGVVQLAADLGSFHDVDPSDMLERIRAGLVGEIEPLRRVGILLTDQVTRQKAVEMGLASSTAEASESAKVQARYALILDQSTKAQGDYARTAHDATNSTRTAAAAYKDAMRELGEEMLPLIAEGAQMVTALAEAFAGLPDPVQKTLLGVGGLVAALGPLLIITGTLIRSLRTIQSLQGRLGSAVGTLGRASLVGGIAVGLNELGDALTRLEKGEVNVDKLGKALADFRADGKVSGELARQFGADLDELGAKLRRTLESPLKRDPLAELVKGNLFDTRDAKKDIDAVDDALAEFVTSGYGDAAKEIFDRLADAARKQGVPLKDVRKALNDYEDAVASADAKAKLAEPATKGLAAGIDKVRSSADGSTRAVDEFAKMIDASLSSTFGVHEELDRFTVDLAEWADQVRAAQEAGDKNAASLDQWTLAGLRNRQALMGMVDTALNVAKAMKENEEPPERIAAAMSVLRRSMLDTAVAIGIPEEKARQIVDVLLRLDGLTVTVDVFADTAQAEAALQRLLAGLSQVAGLSGEAGAIVAGIVGSKPLISPFGDPGASQAVRDAIAGLGPNATSARDSAAGGARQAAEEAARAAAAARQQRLEIAEAQFRAGVGSLEEYQAALDAQLAHEVPWTAAWVALQEKKAEAVRFWPDAAMKYLEALHEAQMEAEDNQFREGRVTSDAYIEMLKGRHDALVAAHGYWSDEARGVRDEVRRVREEVAREAEEVAREAEKARGEAFDRLTRLLDDEQAIRARMRQHAEDHQKRMAEIRGRFSADEQRILDDRKQALLGWANVSQRVTVGWGNTLGALTSNIRSQIDQFAEWADQLGAARASGVSEAVISLLGLDEGPQALGQLRMFSTATQAEIDALNQAVEDRAAQAGSQVAAEAASSYTQVGKMLADLAEKHAAEVEALTEQFLADQRALRDELKTLGEDQGRSYGDAIAEGLRSSIPAIREAAREAQRALGSSGKGAKSSGPTQEFVDFYNSQTPDVQRYLDAVGRMHDGGIVSGSPGSEQLRMLQAGERVLSVPDNQQLISAIRSVGAQRPVVNVTAVLEVDGQRIPVNVKALESWHAGDHKASAWLAAVSGGR